MRHPTTSLPYRMDIRHILRPGGRRPRIGSSTVGGRLSRHGTTIGGIVRLVPTTAGDVAARVSRDGGVHRARSWRTVTATGEATPSRPRSSSSIASCPTGSSLPSAICPPSIPIPFRAPRAPLPLLALTLHRRCPSRRRLGIPSRHHRPNPSLSLRRKTARSSAHPRPKLRLSRRARTRHQLIRAHSTPRAATFRLRADRPRLRLHVGRYILRSTRVLRARPVSPPALLAHCGRASATSRRRYTAEAEACRTRRTSLPGAHLRTAIATEGGTGAAIGVTTRERGSRARRGGEGGGRGGGDHT